MGLRSCIRKAADENGQASVEYAIIFGVFMCVVVALGVLAKTLDLGVFVEHALAAASHHVRASLQWAVDVFCF